MNTDDFIKKVNDTDYNLKVNTGIIKQFKTMANKFPERKCVCFNDTSYTYKEFDIITDRLASYLKKNGAKAGDIIAIYQNRDEKFLISMFAILKLNATYIPLEKIYPSGRVSNILKLCKAKYVLTDENVTFNFYSKIIFLPEISELPNDYSFEFNEIDPYNSAYIIFTSGSTGTPKGIEIMQPGIVNLAIAMFDTIFENKSSCKNIAVISPFVFDASVGQIYTALLCGCTLDIIPDDVKMSYEKLDEFFLSRQIDCVEITPTRLNAQIQYYEQNKTLKYFPPVIISAGEALNISLAKRFFCFDKLKSVKIYDFYGPTECTVYCTYKEINYDNINSLDAIPIGKPINNTKVYVLDEHLNPCPIGVKGELYISGIGLSKGYITSKDNDNINKNSFIDNPFDSWGKLYKTGDICAFSENGDLLYFGRKDDQIKIHGFRIELSEIEELFRKLDGVTQAKAIVVNDNDEDKIVLYYTFSKSLNIKLIREYLKENLPYYMIPSYVVPTDNFKCNLNGKLDKSALCDYHDFSFFKQDDVSYTNDDLFINEFIDICKSSLGKDNITASDNFVCCGGTSLDILKINTILYQNYDILLSVSDFFECDNFYELAQKCKTKINSVATNKTNIIESKIKNVPASKFQQTLINCEKISAENRKLGYKDIDNINIISLVESNIKYDIKKLKYALSKVINRHDIFKASFKSIDRKTYMILNENCNGYFNIEYVKNINEINYKNYFSMFDISKPPLFKITLFIDKSDNQTLLIDIHHAIFDHISTSIFLNDLFAFYFDKPLPDIKIPLFDYLYQIENMSFDKEKKFWNKYLQDRKLVVPLSYDKEKEFFKFRKGNHTTYENTIIDGNTTNKLRKICSKTGITEYHLLFNILALCLGHIEKKDDLFISTLVSGRNNIKLKAMPYIYLFTKIVPIRFKINSEEHFLDFLKKQNKSFNEVLENSVLDIEDVYRTMSFKDIVKGRLTCMLFNYVEECKLNLPDINIKTTDLAGSPDTLPMYIIAVPKENYINLNIKYMDNLYTKEKIKTFVHNYLKTIELSIYCLENNKKISDLFNMLDENLNTITI